MNAELLEHLFFCFLKEKKVVYTYDKEVFRVRFGKELKELFGEKLHCSFNNSVAEKEKVEFIGKGHRIVDIIASLYADELPVSAVMVSQNDEGILEAEESIAGLKEEGQYILTDYRKTFPFFAFVVNVNSTVKKEEVFVPLFYDEEFDMRDLNEDALKMKFETLEKIPDLDFDEVLEKAKKELTHIMGKDLAQKEEGHTDFVNSESYQKKMHYENMIKELDAKEQRMREQINGLERDARLSLGMGRSSSYDKMTKVKSMRRKLEGELDDLKEKRNAIIQEMNFHLKQFESREFSITARLVAFAYVDLQVIRISYKHGKSFAYFPAAKKIVPAKQMVEIQDKKTSAKH